MDSRRFELEADLKEIDRLLSLSTRDLSKTILVTHRLKLAEELKSLPIASSSPASSSIPDDKLWKPIDRFAWEQTDDEIKVYVTCLDGLKSHPSENIFLESNSNSLSVSITNFNDANHRLRFIKFTKDIKEARISVKSNGFTVTIKKKEKGRWDALVPKNALIKKEEEEEKPADAKDPGDSLMKMMKDLYDNGDDDMKKTISEAWAKSKDKEPV